MRHQANRQPLSQPHRHHHKTRQSAKQNVTSNLWKCYKIRFLLRSIFCYGLIFYCTAALLRLSCSCFIIIEFTLLSGLFIHREYVLVQKFSLRMEEIKINI